MWCSDRGCLRNLLFLQENGAVTDKCAPIASVRDCCAQGVLQIAIMKPLTSGLVLAAIGVLHNTIGAAVGLAYMADPLGDVVPHFRDIWRFGVESTAMRMAIFWFMAFGFVLMLLGWVLHQLERQQIELPAVAGYGLLALALGGGVLLPLSGFWLALIPGVLILWRAQARTDIT